MKRLASVLVVAATLSTGAANGALMVRELWEGVGSSTLGGMGDGATSIGFEPGSTWYVNLGTLMRVASDFNLVSGAPDTLPGLPPLVSGLGGIWGDDTGLSMVWDTGCWATRQLAAGAQVNLAADGVVYIAVRLNNAGDTACGVGFSSAGDATGDFIGAGFMWNNAGGGAANNAVYITGGNLASATPYTILANGAAGQINGRGLMVCRLTTVASGNDTIEAKVFPPGTAVPADPSTIAWDTSLAFASDSLATHLLMWMNGSGQDELDAIRIGRSFVDVIGIEVRSALSIQPSTTVYAGTPVTISLAATNDASAPLVSHWYRGATYVGSTAGTTWVISNPVPGDSGDYHAVLSNLFGTVDSATNSLTVNAASAPVITADPPSTMRFVGGRVTFPVAVEGTPPYGYRWQKNSGDLAGQTAPTLTLTNVGPADQAGYRVIVTNMIGAATSAVATLTVTTPPAGSYEEVIVTNRPVAYWRLNEETGSTAYDYMGGNDAAHTAVGFPVEGPRPTSLPLAFLGLDSTNYAASYDGATSGSSSTASLLNNRPAFTMMGWINSAADQLNRTGFFGQNDVAEFGYHGVTNVGLWTPGGGMVTFPSTLITNGQWQFLAAVASGTNLSIYLNGNLIGQAGNATTNYGASTSPFRFGGGGILDTGGNTFNGMVDEVAVFDRALTVEEINQIYTVACGTAVPPSFLSFPRSTFRYQGFDIVFDTVLLGTLPMVYQWQKGGADLPDGGGVSGAQTGRLTITNVAPGHAGSYRLLVSNGSGESITSEVITVTVRVPAAGSYEAAIVTNRPLAYWRLNEETGDRGYDYAGGHDAVHDTVTFPVAGPQPGSAPIAFTGMESNNYAASYDGITSGSSSDASLANNRSNFTMLGWVNLAGGQLARAGLFGQNDVLEFGFHDVNNIGMWSPGSGLVSFPVSRLNLGEWAFLGVVGASNGVTLYLNGEPVVTGGTGTNGFGSSASPFRIGGGGILDATGNTLYGSVDEVAFFDRALSSLEINRLYGVSRGGAAIPTLTSLPLPRTRYVGRDAVFGVQATGTIPFQFQWQRNGVDLSNGGAVSGAQSQYLTITDAALANAGDYRVIVSNGGGAVTSEVAALTILEPAAWGGEAGALAYDPVAFWRLNEASGSVANDAWGGYDGTYGAATVQGQAGPQPPEVYGFEAGNLAVQTVANTDASWVSVPALNLNTNAMTITCWLYAIGDQGNWRGLVFSRAGGTVAGLHFGGDNALRYTWNDEYLSWSWSSGLYVPTNQWIFAAVVVTPADATIYMGDNQGRLQSAVNVLTHVNQGFGSLTTLGIDSIGDATRVFNGVLDEVAIFNRSLSSAEIMDIYEQGAGLVRLDIDPVPGTSVITWPMGVLQSAPSPEGPYEDVPGATSPYTNAPPSKAQFFRTRQP